MNFEPYEVLLNSQAKKFDDVQAELDHLNNMKREAAVDLQNTDKVSRQAFAISGEIQQLNEAILKAEKKQKDLIYKHAPQMKLDIKKIRERLIREEEKRLMDKHTEKVKSAVDHLITALEAYIADESEFKKKISEDILKFKFYDDNAFPDINYESTAHMFGYSKLSQGELARIFNKY